MNLQAKLMFYFVFVIVISGIILSVTPVTVIKIATIVIILLLGVIVPRNILNTLKRTTEKVKEVEQKIMENNKKLIEFDKMKANFISLVGHELRTPLSSIKESVSLVSDESTGKINDKQKEMLAIADRNIVRLTRLIDDVLDLSKIEAGKLGVRRTPLDLNKLIKEIFNEMYMSAKNKKITLEIDLYPNLPEAYADPDRITQVIVNLINNAIKYTPQEGKITIATRQSDQRFLEISVIDTGIGIKVSDYDRIFNKFQQIDYQMNRRIEGVGLGLVISKGLVEAHGGRIWFDSEFGKGSKFIFSLPLYQQNVSFENYLAEELQSSQKEKGFLSLIVLTIQGIKENKELFNNLERLIRQIVFGSHDIVVPYIPETTDAPKDTVTHKGIDKEIGFTILARTDKRGATSIAKRVKKNILEHKFLGNKIKLNVRVGIATYPVDAIEKDKLIKKVKNSLNISQI